MLFKTKCFKDEVWFGSPKTRLKLFKPIGVTDAQLDLLFKRYEEVR